MRYIYILWELQTKPNHYSYEAALEIVLNYWQDNKNNPSKYLSNPKNMEIIKMNTFIQQGYNKFVKNAVKTYIVIHKNKSSYF